MAALPDETVAGINVRASRSQKVAFMIARAASGVPPAEQEVYRIVTMLRASGDCEGETKAGAADREN